MLYFQLQSHCEVFTIRISTYELRIGYTSQLIMINLHVRLKISTQYFTAPLTGRYSQFSHSVSLSWTCDSDLLNTVVMLSEGWSLDLVSWSFFPPAPVLSWDYNAQQSSSLWEDERLEEGSTTCSKHWKHGCNHLGLSKQAARWCPLPGFVWHTHWECCHFFVF